MQFQLYGFGSVMSWILFGFEAFSRGGESILQFDPSGKNFKVYFSGTKSTVLPANVFKKQKCFFVLFFHCGVFLLWKSVS